MGKTATRPTENPSQTECPVCDLCTNPECTGQCRRMVDTLIDLFARVLDRPQSLNPGTVPEKGKG